MSHTITAERFEAADPRLGRHVHHDSRSLNYEFLPRSITPLRKSTFWKSPYVPLNQGSLGSCVGNSVAGVLNTSFMTNTRKLTHNNRKFYESDAIHIYSVATTYDSDPQNYPPHDTGANGITGAKAGVSLGYLDSYSHTFSFSAAQAAAERTPFIQGTLWTKTMFIPTNGLVSVGPLRNSNIAGGHEYECAGIDWTEEVFVYRNSWGNQDDWPGCKPGGYFAITFDDVQELLGAQGDVTILHGKGQK